MDDRRHLFGIRMSCSSYVFLAATILPAWGFISFASEPSTNVEWPKQWTVFAPSVKNDPVPSEAVLKTIPDKLLLSGREVAPRKVDVNDKYGRVDLANLIGGTKDGNAAYVFLPIRAEQDQELVIGMGADWYLQAWLDGKLIQDTTQTGNGNWPPSVTDHKVKVFLAKGEHVLAVRFISGTGSSVLALGGPREIELGTPTLPLFRNDPVPAGNMLPLGEFEEAAKPGDHIPKGWKNGKGDCAFRQGELTLTESGPISGNRSLEINTMSGGTVKRKISIPVEVDVSTLYEVSFKAKHIAGKHTAFYLSYDEDNGFSTVFVRAIGADNLKNSLRKSGGQPGALKIYSYFDRPQVWVVIQANGPTHVVIDDICIIPVSENKKWIGSEDQRAPWRKSLDMLSSQVVTPHIKWCNPNAGGLLRLLSIMPRSLHRRTVELSQRMSLECTPIFYEFNPAMDGTFEMGQDYWIYDTDGDPLLFEKKADALAKLEAGADCILISDLQAETISDFMAEAVLEKVKNGSGLAIRGSCFSRFTPKRFKEGIWGKALSPQNKTDEQTDFIMYAPASVYRYNRPDNGFYQYGKGRIAIWSDHFSDDQQGYEQNLPYLMKALLWSANRVPKSRIAVINLPGNRIDQSAFRVNRSALPAFAKVEIKTDASLPQDARLVGWVDDFDGSKLPVLAETELGSDQCAAEIPLPKLPAGKHWIHFQLKNGGSVEDWASVGIEVLSDSLIKTVALTDGKPYYKAGEIIHAKVVLTANLQADQKLKVELLDTDGLLWNVNYLNGTGTEFNLDFSLEDPKVLMHEIRASILDDSGTVSVAKTLFAIIKSAEWYSKFFDFQIWCLPETNYFACKALRNQGVTSGFYAKPSIFAAAQNIRVVPPVAIHWEQPNKPGVFFKHHKTELVGNVEHAPERYPCLTDPVFLDQVAANIAENVPQYLNMAPLAYGLAHESNLQSYGQLKSADICFSPTCKKSFREFLKGDYKELSILNHAWQTDFKTWDDVTPSVLSDAVESGQIVRWIDHRRHMDKVYTDYLRFKVEAVRRFDPAAEGCGDNFRVASNMLDSYSGVDYWRLFSEVVAGAGLPEKYLLSFTPPERQHLIMARGAYWYSDIFTDDSELLQQRFGNQPWRNLFAGMHGYAYFPSHFFLYPSSTYPPVLNADLSEGYVGKIAADAVSQIRSGIDRLIFESKCDNSGIAILFSRSSEHAASAWQFLHKGKSAARLSPPSLIGVYSDMLNYLGYGYSFLSEAQIADHALQKGGFRLLIMPFSQALNPDVQKPIMEFLSQGGTVMADIRPGIADQHGQIGTKGFLDELFGVCHQTEYQAYAPTLDTVRIGEDFLGNKLPSADYGVIMGPYVKIEGAKALAESRTGKIPGLCVNSYGKGNAVLLNFAFDKLDADMLKLFGEMLAAAGIKPLFGIESKPLEESSSPLLSFSRLSGLLGMEKEENVRKLEVKPVGRKLDDHEVFADAEGYMANNLKGLSARPKLAHFVNGRIHLFAYWYAPERRGNGMERVTVTPPVSGYVYNIKTNEYIGNCRSSFSLEMPLEGLGAFAVLPYKIERPSLTVKKEGERAVACETVLEPDDAVPEFHSVRMRLFAPDGTEWKDFASTARAVKGMVAHTFILPLNAPEGIWKVEAREAISGLASIENIEINCRPK